MSAPSKLIRRSAAGVLRRWVDIGWPFGVDGPGNFRVTGSSGYSFNHPGELNGQYADKFRHEHAFDADNSIPAFPEDLLEARDLDPAGLSFGRVLEP